MRAEAHVNHDRERHLVGHPVRVSTLSKTDSLSSSQPEGAAVANPSARKGALV